MEFIFGGAYQGMEEYAQNMRGASKIVRLDADMREIDFTAADAFNGLELFVLGCVRRGESIVSYFERHSDEWADKMLIGLDFSCGVVPMDAEMRLWREENGRLNNYLAQHAARVARLFCGIPQVIRQ